MIIIPNSGEIIHNANTSIATGGNRNSSVSTRVFKIVAELVFTPCSTKTQTQVPLLRKTHTKKDRKRFNNGI